jgi:hypothetical protein
LQALSYNRLGVGQGGKHLVALDREQEPFGVAAKAFPLCTSTEEIVESASLDLKWTGGGFYRQTFGERRYSVLRRHQTMATFLMQQTTANLNACQRLANLYPYLPASRNALMT